MSSSVSNMVVIEPANDNEYTFQQVFELLNHMTAEQAYAVKGDCGEVIPKQRTPFHHTYLRCFATAMKTKELSAKTPLMKSAVSPSEEVAPLESFINLDQRGSRMMEQTGGGLEWFTLRDLFNRAELMMKYGIVILGSNDTTGFGKSQLAMRLACHFAQSFTGERPA